MWGNYYKSNKYGNAKVTVEGITFDSKREARRYLDLLLLEKAGDISDLQRQVKYVLIPAQREPDIIGPKGGRKPGKLLEHEVSYVADFVYKDYTAEYEEGTYKVKREGIEVTKITVLPILPSFSYTRKF